MAASSVEGLGEFRRHMQGLEGSYVLIGGIACDILLSEADLPFRATHDFDTVLVADARLPETARAVWALVRDGGYQCGRGAGGSICFYRFTNPTSPGYPHIIEMFSRRPVFLEGVAGGALAPLHIDDEVSSLSAIVLDDAYYELLLRGATIIDGVSVLDESHLIPFKAKAYLDLKARRERGEQVDSRKIKKHKRDALRLAQLLSGDEDVSLPGPVVADMEKFLADCEADPVNLKQIGVAGISMDGILTAMRSAYIRE